MKITEEKVAEILAEVESGKTLSEIAERLGIPYHDLWEACYGRTGKRIRPDYSLQVQLLVESGFSTPYISKKLGISTAAVSKIYKRQAGVSISQYRKTRSVRYGQK